MDEPVPHGGEKARLRIEQLKARLERLRHGDPVSPTDVATERANSIEAAERARAEAARRHAEEERAEAAEDFAIADQRRENP